jgi:hypothetical protein
MCGMQYPVTSEVSSRTSAAHHLFVFVDQMVSVPPTTFSAAILPLEPIGARGQKCGTRCHVPAGVEPMKPPALGIMHRLWTTPSRCPCPGACGENGSNSVP